MSKFLGKIHYWLFDKIAWFESLEQEIIDWGKGKSDLSMLQWEKESIEKFGAPVGRVALEDVIDTSNIHGWLQDKINRAELRQAFIITKVIDSANGQNYKEDLKNIYKSQGTEAGAKHKGEYALETPDEIFNVINNYILEGMPCDRVNEVSENTKDVFSWFATTCLHTQYWNQVQGNVSNFYALREEWTRAFVESLSDEYAYEVKDENGHRLNTIYRK